MPFPVFTVTVDKSIKASVLSQLLQVGSQQLTYTHSSFLAWYYSYTHLFSQPKPKPSVMRRINWNEIQNRRDFADSSCRVLPRCYGIHEISLSLKKGATEYQGNGYFGLLKNTKKHFREDKCRPCDLISRSAYSTAFPRESWKKPFRSAVHHGEAQRKVIRGWSTPQKHPSEIIPLS